MFSKQQGKTLLRLARQSIEVELGITANDSIPDEALDDPLLRQHQGVFVTLNKKGMLRGCIGSLLGVESIVDGVRRHAVNAAIHDHRFPLLTTNEAAEVEIEISLLTLPQELEYSDGVDLVKKLRPNIDGVILKVPGGTGATFLPQVWEQLPIPEMFLDQLCRKAGLPAQSWLNSKLSSKLSEKLRVQTYQVIHFTEASA